MGEDDKLSDSDLAQMSARDPFTLERDIAEQDRRVLLRHVTALRLATAELLAALPKCSICSEMASANVGTAGDDGALCQEHASTTRMAISELPTAAPAARLRALLGKAGA